MLSESRLRFLALRPRMEWRADQKAGTRLLRDRLRELSLQPGTEAGPNRLRPRCAASRLQESASLRHARGPARWQRRWRTLLPAHLAPEAAFQFLFSLALERSEPQGRLRQRDSRCSCGRLELEDR